MLKANMHWSMAYLKSDERSVVVLATKRRTADSFSATGTDAVAAQNMLLLLLLLLLLALKRGEVWTSEKGTL